MAGVGRVMMTTTMMMMMMVISVVVIMGFRNYSEKMIVIADVRMKAERRMSYGWFTHMIAK